MPQFTRQSTRPLSPRAIAGAVRRYRQLCDIIERYRDPQTTREKQQLTRAINGLAYAAKSLSARHRAAETTARASALPRSDTGAGLGEG